MREANKSLQFEVDDLKQKLKDAQGDIKVHFTRTKEPPAVRAAIQSADLTYCIKHGTVYSAAV